MADKKKETISKYLEYQEILSAVQPEIDRAQEYADLKTTDRNKAWDRYYGKLLGNERAGHSKFITREVMDTIEWMMPFFMRTFAAGDPKIDLEVKGQAPWVGKALMQEIVRILTQSTPNLFLLLYTWFKDALVSDTAFVKIAWEIEHEWVKLNFDTLDQSQMNRLQQDPDIEVLEGMGFESLPGIMTYRDVKIKVKRQIKSTFDVENVPHWEFLADPRSRDINDEYGKGHKTEVTIDYLKRINEQRGGNYFEGLDELKASSSNMDIGEADTYNEEERTLSVFGDTNLMDTGPKQHVEFIEWYTKLDVNNDGFLEDIVCYIANGKLLRWEINEEGFIPFSAAKPIIDCYKFYGISWANLITEIQNLKTMLFRRILDNFDFQNSGRWLVDPDASVDRVALMDNRPGTVVMGKVDGLKDLTPAPFQPGTLSILEYVDTIKENRTGITRYNQGMDAASLNKMLDINTPVPMADGTYKKMGDIKTGDRIIGSDGHATMVVQAHPISTPKKAYKITFASGETIVACSEHLWRVQKYGRKWHVVDTETIAKEGVRNKSGTRKWYIPRVIRPHFDDAKDELPLDPYILGAWLGDGHSDGARFTISDEFVLARIKKWAKKTGHNVIEDEYQNSGKAKTYRVTKGGQTDKKTGQFVENGSLHSILKNAKLLKRYGGKKHIPEVYFRASYEDRLELLRGLMDTDGCHHSNALVLFIQKKGQLSDDVIRLIESLGGWPKINITKNPGKWAVKGNEYLQINFTLPDNPFSTPKKAAKFVPSKRMQERQSIVAIEPVEPCPMRCLTVDDKHGTYCVGRRFTVTHNTATGIIQIQTAAMQRMELVARIFAETGLKDFYKKCAILYRKYMTKPIQVKVQGTDYTLTPDMLQGEIIATVNMGVEASIGVQEGQKVQAVMALLLQLNREFPGIIGPEQIHNLAARYVSAMMGSKQVENFISNLKKWLQERQQQMQAQNQMQQQLLQMQKQMKELELAIKKQEADTKVMAIQQKDKDSQRDYKLGLLKILQDSNSGGMPLV